MNKPARGQMKCFHCRKPASTKDGNWRFWKNAQVFLCKICDQTTRERPERREGK